MFAGQSDVYYLPQVVLDTIASSNDGPNVIHPTTWYRIFQSLIEASDFSQLSLYWFSFSSDHRIFAPNLNSPHDFSIEREVIWRQVDERDNITIYS